jgi:hypothetical protein
VASAPTADGLVVINVAWRVWIDTEGAAIATDVPPRVQIADEGLPLATNRTHAPEQRTCWRKERSVRWYEHGDRRVETVVWTPSCEERSVRWYEHEGVEWRREGVNMMVRWRGGGV